MTMRNLRRLLRSVLGLLGGLALLAGSRAAADPPPLLLVSMDAFRWDYCALHPAETPHLRQLAAEGISARELIPVYPSNTFPNHYAIVTGLYPAHSGIIDNDFFDPISGAYFHYNVSAIALQSHWWGGEPIWITAVKQGRTSAVATWPSSEVVIEGARPTYFEPFTNVTDLHDNKRVGRMIRWLTAPVGPRPAFMAMYLEEGNATGHKYGPDSPQMVATIKLLDGRIGEIMDDLKAAKLDANVIVVSDHGMANISPERVLVIEDYLDPATVQVDFHNPCAGLRPLRGTAEDLVHALAHLPHAKVYLTKNLPAAFASSEFWNRLFHPSQYLPARFHLTDNPRIPPVWIIPDEGWEVQPRAYFNTYRATFYHGDHGFDNALPDMHGVLIAHGPSFKNDGEVIPTVPNIDIYNLMCAALQLTPAPNDGDDRLVRAFLR